MRLAIVVLLVCAAGHADARKCTWGKSCILDGDFDGDGKSDRAARVRHCVRGKCRIGLEIEYASGERATLGLKRQKWLVMYYVEEGWAEEDAPVHLSWITAWKVWPAGRTNPIIPGLRGDAVWLSSSDVAVVVWHDGKRWRMHHLGY